MGDSLGFLGGNEIRGDQNHYLGAFMFASPRSKC